MTREGTRRWARTTTLLAAAAALMLLTGCNDLKGENTRLMAQNRELQAELDRARAALDSASAQPMMAAQSGFEGIEGVDVIQGAGTITVRVPGDVLFASGKVDLRQGAQTTLQQIASVISNEYSTETIRVEGYTDTDPIKRSGWKDNLELSLQRAAAVQRFLQTQGVANEMYSAGFGEQRARDSKANSRRVEIVVVMQE